jgi:hypothetical protein
MMMSRKIVEELSQRYTRDGLDFISALKTWRKANLNSENIRDQVYDDIGERLTSGEAKELHIASDKIANYGFKLEDFGMADKVPSGMVPDGTYKTTDNPRMNKNWGGAKVEAKDYEFSKGREDLIPANIKNRDKVVFSPSVRMSVFKVDNNIYRSKTAAKYWTLKEKVGEDGNKVMYLVAIDDSPEDIQVKEARYKIAQDSTQDPNAQPVQNPPLTGDVTQQTPTTQQLPNVQQTNVQTQTPVQQGTEVNQTPEGEKKETSGEGVKTDTSSEADKVNELITPEVAQAANNMQGKTPFQLVAELKNAIESNNQGALEFFKQIFYKAGKEGDFNAVLQNPAVLNPPSTEEVVKGFSQGQQGQQPQGQQVG